MEKERTNIKQINGGCCGNFMIATDYTGKREQHKLAGYKGSSTSTKQTPWSGPD